MLLYKLCCGLCVVQNFVLVEDGDVENKLWGPLSNPCSIDDNGWG